MGRPHQIEAVVAGVLKQARERHGALSMIQARWASLVGQPLAGHTRPVSLRRRQLVVETDRPGDGFALRYQRPQLLEKLRRTVREYAVEDIVIRPGGCRT